MAKQSILAGEKLGAFLCVRDRVKAKTFFGETLGLKLTHEDEYALVFDANGTTVARLSGR